MIKKKYDRNINDQNLTSTQALRVSSIFRVPRYEVNPMEVINH